MTVSNKNKVSSKIITTFKLLENFRFTSRTISPKKFVRKMTTKHSAHTINVLMKCTNTRICKVALCKHVVFNANS